MVRRRHALPEKEVWTTLKLVMLNVTTLNVIMEINLVTLLFNLSKDCKIKTDLSSLRGDDL